MAVNREKWTAVRIYTKTGDDGTTGLLGAGRVSKDAVRVDAYGTVDELNAALGVARAHSLDADSDALLARLQDELFVLGSALADPVPEGRFHRAMTAQHVQTLESAIDRLEDELPALAHFILPGGCPAAAQIHLARAVCRRAERAAVALSRAAGEDVPPVVLVYLNRLSDLLFVLGRSVNRRAGVADVIWKGL
jgi:cob(I)alamin adenosyltransferase